MARGLGPSGLARAPHERGGQKKGDFSHLGDSPPLPAVPITAIDCVRNLSTYGTVLRAEPFCSRNRSACGTVVCAEPFCLRSRSACGMKWNPKSRRVYIGRYIYRSACGTFLPAEHCKELRSPIDMHRNIKKH